MFEFRRNSEQVFHSIAQFTVLSLKDHIQLKILKLHVIVSKMFNLHTQGRCNLNPTVIVVLK